MTVESPIFVGVARPRDDDLLFKALADPTRRALLDALFVRDGQSVHELCAVAPDMTRFGVMKHLGVLEEANVLVTVRDGRTKRHFLNTVPIQQLVDRWIGKYAQPVTRALVDLQSHLEHQEQCS